MSPKQRNKEHRSLPRNWRKKGDSYFYRVPKSARHHWDGKTEFKLGNTLAEAHQTFAERVGYEGKVGLMEQLCDRYLLEVIPTKAPATQRSNRRSMERIRSVFSGANQVRAVMPVHLYEYQDWCIQNHGVKYAALDHEVLSHMFTCAIRWGIIAVHPMTGKKVVKPSTGPGRKVMPIESEMIAFIKCLPVKWQLYMQLKIWLARRKGEMLRITKFDITDKGIRFVNNKNPNDVFTQPWEPETFDIVQRIQALPGAQHNTFLFENRKHEPYIKEDGSTSGFDSMWQRNMTKAIKEGIVTVRFTEHDCRKVRPSQLSTTEAQEMLRHTNPQQTKTYQVDNILALPRRSD